MFWKSSSDGRCNVPSLLAMPYLGDVNVNDPIYQNTRRFVWSEDNPYFFKGKAAKESADRISL
jgi:meiotically up-regulated gene 157 (Mug157) protein